MKTITCKHLAAQIRWQEKLVKSKVACMRDWFYKNRKETPEKRLAAKGSNLHRGRVETETR